MLASVQGSIGSIRYILKDGLKYFPIYGFYFRQVGRMIINPFIGPDKEIF